MTRNWVQDFRFSYSTRIWPVCAICPCSWTGEHKQFQLLNDVNESQNYSCVTPNCILITVIRIIFNLFTVSRSSHPWNKFLGWIENTICLNRANIASRRFFVILQCAFLAKVVLASGERIRHGLDKTQLTQQHTVTYFVTIGSTKLLRQMKHLNGKLSSSEWISYFVSSPSESASLPRNPAACSCSNCQPAL